MGSKNLMFLGISKKYLILTQFKGFVKNITIFSKNYLKLGIFLDEIFQDCNCNAWLAPIGAILKNGSSWRQWLPMHVIFRKWLQQVTNGRISICYLLKPFLKSGWESHGSNWSQRFQKEGCIRFLLHGEQKRPFFEERLGSYCRVRLNRNQWKMALIGATFSTLKTWGRKNQMFLDISNVPPIRIFLASIGACKNWEHKWLQS